jgi:hypothetical protein
MLPRGLLLQWIRARPKCAKDLLVWGECQRPRGLPSESVIRSRRPSLSLAMEWRGRRLQGRGIIGSVMTLGKRGEHRAKVAQSQTSGHAKA